MVGNGKPRPPVAQVVITVDPAKATEANPNGIVCQSSLPDAILIVRLLSETIMQLTDHIKHVGTAPSNVSSSIVLPDGSAAPLPKKT